MNDILEISEEEEKLLFKYGLFILFYNVFTLFIVLLIGKLLNEMYFVLLLMIFYIPIRVIIGGYHCKSTTTCLLTFSLIIICTIMSYKLDLHNILVILSIPAYILTLYYVTQENTTKLTKFALILFTIEFILCFINNIIGHVAYYSIMLISLLYLINIIIRNRE